MGLNATRIWGLGDPHLSFAKPKPMDIFGPQWTNHPERIARNTAMLVGADDILLIPGDISWAMRRADAVPDLAYLAGLPGTKVLIKGNHDYWWDSDRPLKFEGLHDTPFISLDGIVGVAGTRGWDELPEGSSPAERAEHQRHVDREVRRLEKRLVAIKDCPRRFAMIHHPPLPDFAPLLKAYGVETVLYGHVHLSGKTAALPEDWLGIRCICVAADRIGFMPRLIATIDAPAQDDSPETG
jgi:hypothetical protein